MEMTSLDSLEQNVVANYDVANTLYILADSLGKNYEKNGISPFDSDFVISEKFIKRIIENKEPKNKIVAPLFLENSNKEIKTFFENSLEENREIVSDLSQMLAQGDFDKEIEQKEEIKDVLTILKARQALLEIDIEKLEDNKEIALDLYCELVNLGKRIEEIMKDTYTKKLEKQIIIQNLIEYAKGLARIAVIQKNQINLQKNIAKNTLNKEIKLEKNNEINKENSQNKIIKNQNEQNIEFIN